MSPHAPPSPCRFPGCPRKSRGRFCEEHATAAAREELEFGIQIFGNVTFRTRRERCILTAGHKGRHLGGALRWGL